MLGLEGSGGGDVTRDHKKQTGKLGNSISISNNFARCRKLSFIVENFAELGDCYEVMSPNIRTFEKVKQELKLLEMIFFSNGIKKILELKTPMTSLLKYPQTQQI